MDIPLRGGGGLGLGLGSKEFLNPSSPRLNLSSYITLVRRKHVKWSLWEAAKSSFFSGPTTKAFTFIIIFSTATNNFYFLF